MLHCNNVKPMFLSLYTVRRPIGLRSPPDRIAFAARLDCVRRSVSKVELFINRKYVFFISD